MAGLLTPSRRAGAARWRPDPRHQPRARLRVPAGRGVSVAHRRRQHRVRTEGARRAQGRAATSWSSTGAEAVGLSAFRDAYPKQLSGGMRKRVDLARAYANSPGRAADGRAFRGARRADQGRRCRRRCSKLWESTRKTVVFVTHDLDEAVFLADIVVVLASRPGPRACAGRATRLGVRATKRRASATSSPPPSARCGRHCRRRARRRARRTNRRANDLRTRAASARLHHQLSRSESTI